MKVSTRYLEKHVLSSMWQKKENKGGKNFFVSSTSAVNSNIVLSNSYCVIYFIKLEFTSVLQDKTM